MLKRFLGIRNLEKKILELNKALSNNWSHTTNLYNLNAVSFEKIKEIEKKLDERTKHIMYVLDKVVKQIDESNKKLLSKDVEKTVNNSYKEVRQPVSQRTSQAVFQLSKNDDLILKILHENAALSEDFAIPTKTIYGNLPFSITERGLRKKLSSLQNMGLVDSIKKGNERNWFIRTGSIMKVKEIIKKRNKIL